MDSYVGSIIMLAFPWVPQGFLPCDGSVYLTQDYAELFAVIGSTYGGDAINTFAVPDLRGRFPLGAGAGEGSTFVNKLPSTKLGELGGTPDLPLRSLDLVQAQPSTQTYSYHVTHPSGELQYSAPHLAINFAICWFGLYPQAMPF